MCRFSPDKDRPLIMSVSRLLSEMPQEGFRGRRCWTVYSPEHLSRLKGNRTGDSTTYSPFGGSEDMTLRESVTHDNMCMRL